MTKFAQKSFSSPANSKAFVDNWDSVFNTEPVATRREDGALVVGPPPDGRSVDEHLDALQKPACNCTPHGPAEARSRPPQLHQEHCAVLRWWNTRKL